MPELREKHIQNEILRAFGTLPCLRLWRANVGVARIGDRLIRFGIPGQADLTGILPDGRRLEIEVKSATGRPTFGAQQWFCRRSSPRERLRRGQDPSPPSIPHRSALLW